jgi:hypothetical protein
VELGKEFMYHPIFACPGMFFILSGDLSFHLRSFAVSREQTTADNPPMLLTCGHVISKASMIKLARGGTRYVFVFYSLLNTV